MNYQEAQKIRGKGFASTMTEKLISGQGIRQSFKSTISEKTRATAKGIKQKFDPMNIAKKLTGGNNLGPALLGRMTGRSQEDIEFFAGKGSKEQSKLGRSAAVSSVTIEFATQILGDIYKLLQQIEEDNKLTEELKNDLEEENESELDRRNQEIITALTGRRKKAPTRREQARQRKEEVKEKKKAKAEEDKKVGVEDKGAKVKPKGGGRKRSTESVRTSKIAPKKQPSFTQKVVGTAQKFLSKAVGIGAPTASKIAAGTAIAAAAGLTSLTAKGESKGGDYNILVGGTRANLTSMTLGEVLQLQKSMIDNKKKYPSSAVGKYQIIKGTLEGAIKDLKLNLNDKFDEKMQEKIFKEYLIGTKRPNISNYVMGKVPDTPENLQKAQMDLAKEFASYGVPRDVNAGEFGQYPKVNIRRGSSLYAGVAGNKASISPDESAIALKQDRMRNEGKVVVPHPGTTPTGVPVPKQSEKIEDLTKKNQELKKDISTQQQKTTNNNTTTNVSKSEDTDTKHDKVDDRSVLEKKTKAKK